MFCFTRIHQRAEVTEKTRLKHKEKWDTRTSLPMALGLDKDHIQADKNSTTWIEC